MPHGAIGLNTSNKEDKKNEKPKANKNSPTYIVKYMMSIVGIADLGYHSDDDIDNAQCSNYNNS
jgi:hypothetical protein